MKFVQTIKFKTDNIDDFIKLSEEGPGDEARGEARAWILQDRDNPGTYMVSVEFPSYEEAMKNNDRPETQEFAAKMRALIGGDPEWGNYDLIREME
jgi:quinol monooxygenase YgiN